MNPFGKMNPIGRLNEFLEDSFACSCHNLNVTLFRAYCHAVGAVDEKFVLGHIDGYAQENGISEELNTQLKREVSRMIQEFYDKTNEKMVASMKK